MQGLNGAATAIKVDPVAALVAEWESVLSAYEANPSGLEFPDPIPGRNHPFETVEWETAPVEIRDETGRVIFSEPNAEYPKSWGEHARTIVTQKYFYGDHEQGFRETSLKQLLTRVSARIAIWAARNRVFAWSEDAQNFYHSLLMIQLHQEFSFNSPVYFNVGTDVYGPAPAVENFAWDASVGAVTPCSDAIARPQISACFIQSIQDNMQSIMALATSEAMLFKRGSGTGTDLSPLRSRREKLSGGGRPSGPVSFMRVYDAVAGIVKSGGKTRRAAKMQTLKCDHPDIMEFIECKAIEERKLHALVRAGYDANFNSDTYSSVGFQNANISMRAFDWFMVKASGMEGDPHYQTIARTTGLPVETLDARHVLRRIAECAHECGDPGLQYDDTMNRWHTVPNHSRINSTNPCSEYVHVDDSACNLASLNVMRFRAADGTFQVERFRSAVDVAITAMETLVDAGSYPTEPIARNSHDLRPLGIGYANVGSYCMSRGWPYDSERSRRYVAAITHLLTARAYRRSAELARILGPFPEFHKNRKEFLNVMSMHWGAAESVMKGQIDSGLPRDDMPLFNAACNDWAEAVAFIEDHGARNSQASCIAPTGTIGFMMDCDTLGIEPEIALVRYKMLAGQGMLTIVNRTVGMALDALRYDSMRKAAILDHIDKYRTIQDVIVDSSRIPSYLDPEHLPVFDCAFPPRGGLAAPYGPAFEIADGPRSIDPMGHVRMMAAATPGVSGAISKTVNMPESSTVDDIFKVYVEAWRLGCKSIAVYRDNSKGSQPVLTAAPQPAPAPEPIPPRRKLPDTRRSVTHKFSIAGHEGYIIVGFFDDETPGEVFIEMSKNGSTVGGLMDVIGIMISLGLQYGVPLAKIVAKLTNQRFEPRGMTGNRDIPFAKSIIDYVGHWLGWEFIPGYRDSARPVRGDGETPAAPAGPGSMDEGPTGETGGIDPRGWLSGLLADDRARGAKLDEALEIMHGPQSMFAAEIHGTACPVCGAVMVQQGSCAQCFNCGATEGGCGG